MKYNPTVGQTTPRRQEEEVWAVHLQSISPLVFKTLMSLVRNGFLTQLIANSQVG